MYLRMFISLFKQFNETKILSLSKATFNFKQCGIRRINILTQFQLKDCPIEIVQCTVEQILFLSDIFVDKIRRANVLLCSDRNLKQDHWVETKSEYIVSISGKEKKNPRKLFINKSMFQLMFSRDICWIFFSYLISYSYIFLNVKIKQIYLE